MPRKYTNMDPYEEEMLQGKKRREIAESLGLEPDPCTDGDLLRRADARVTPLCLDVKGTMNGFAALDIHVML